VTNNVLAGGADEGFGAPEFVHGERVFGGERKVVALVVEAAHTLNQIEKLRGSTRLMKGRALGAECATSGAFFSDEGRRARAGRKMICSYGNS
jgi:hypothetical protein